MGATSTFAVTATKAGQPSAPTLGKRVSFKLSNSYANPNGDTIALHTLLGIAAVDILAVILDPVALYFYFWDRAAGTIHAYVNSTGAEVANATDLSGVTVTGTVLHE